MFYPSDISHRAFEDIVSVSRDEASLSSPEVLRRLERSEETLPERIHASVLGSRLSELSALNSTGFDLPHVKTSPRVVMEPPHSRTITPDPATHSTHSPGSVSPSDNFSMLDSLDTDKVCGTTLPHMLPFVRVFGPYVFLNMKHFVLIVFLIRCVSWKDLTLQHLHLLLAPPPPCQHQNGPVMDTAAVSVSTLSYKSGPCWTLTSRPLVLKQTPYRPSFCRPSNVVKQLGQNTWT